MSQVTFSYEGISIGVLAEKETDIQWLKEFLLPWFDMSGDDVPDVRVRVTCDPARYEQLMACGRGDGSINALMLDTSIIAFPLWNAPGKQLAFYDEDREIFYRVTDNYIELILRDRNADIRTRLMRVLRELAMGVAQMQGGRFLHASAFVVEGSAAIITGPRQAGKTSLLSYILSNSEAKFLTNDRLLVHQCGQSVRLRGMPTIVSVREGTMNLFPEFRQSIIDHRFTSDVTLLEARQLETHLPRRVKQGSHGLSPRQFCTILDCQPTRDARGGVLIFPRQTGRAGGLRLRRLEPGEARIQLEQCLFGHIGPDRLSEAFTILPHRLDRKAAPGDAALQAGLARALPSYDCELGNDAYADDRGAKQLLGLLRSRNGPRQPDATAISCRP